MVWHGGATFTVRCMDHPAEANTGPHPRRAALAIGAVCDPRLPQVRLAHTHRSRRGARPAEVGVDASFPATARQRPACREPGERTGEPALDSWTIHDLRRTATTVIENSASPALFRSG